ncbi:hypothetical protein RIF29_41569 [Crotalaria pallida]|uniref:Glycosyltransferase n=1 Tax=Crotalaria pallida TaxID=3830 RepID=A0AAN9E5N8_CROPI
MDMASSLEKKKKHVAVLSFPFGSHPFPLYNLILKLSHAAPHLTFSFFGTASFNKHLFSKPNIPHNIIPYSVDDGIPKGYALGSHPIERVNFFLQACQHNMQKAIDLAVEETKQKITCIIADAFVTPSLLVAQNLNVPWLPVWAPFSCSLAAHFYTDLIREKCANSDAHSALDFIPGLSKMLVGDLPEDVILKGEEEETLFSKTLASLGKVLPQAEAVVLNVFEELDPPLLVQDMRSKLKPYLYVGFLTLSLPLPPLPSSESDETGCLSWLDEKSVRSVVYLGFGTVVTPPPHEIVALAEALEESGFPFLWSINEDHGKGLLPKGFLERTSLQGKFVPWAPQTQVLGYESVGVFVTHCGGNSVCESISNGVPMICRPFFGDHGMTGRMVEDIWEVGVKIEGGVFSKNGLLTSLDLILVQEKGKRMREKALELKRRVEDAAGPQGKAVQDFKTLVEAVSTF